MQVQQSLDGLGGLGLGGLGLGPPQPLATADMSSLHRLPTWPHHAVPRPSAAASAHFFWLMSEMNVPNEAN